MGRTLIKICGVRDRDTALAAANAGIDAVGLVFVEKSPRHVTLDQAREVIDALPAFIEPVALFVDAPVQVIRETALALAIRTVQLHGHETPEVAAGLSPLRVIKAIAFHDDEGAAFLNLWKPAPPNLCAILIDAPPDGSPLPGGAGRTFDWRALARWQQAGELEELPPLILAGGLTPDNVRRAIETVHPYAVDVSSGVESSRGIKDPGLIRAFVEAVG